MKNRIITALMCATLLIGTAGCTANETSVSAVSQTDTTSENGVEETADENSVNPDIVVDSGVDYLEGHEKFEVTSTDLENGVWADIISNTDRGTNASPQLKWEAVDGATEYVIYMVDMNANGFIHWKSKGITDTEIPQGWAASSDYVGPWPAPGFTHIYEIYVVALKEPVDRLKGGLNSGNPKFEEFIKGLDSDSEGNPGNVLAYGKISGKFTG